MDFKTLAAERYSVRKFQNCPVPRDVIDQILEAARLAPTGCNNQPQKILVVCSPEGLDKLKKCTRCHFDAPLAFIICYDKNMCWTRPFDGKSSGDIDGSIVTTHMMLEAAALGVGSTWVMYYDPEAVRTEFSLAENLESVAILVMGYAAEDAVPAPKHSESRDTAEMVQFF